MRNVQNYKELSVGMQTDGIEVASVGNTLVLHDSCLVEAFNLKAAIQFNMKKSILICLKAVIIRKNNLILI